MTTARAPRSSASPRNPARRARRVPRALCAWSLAALAMATAPAALAGSPITLNGSPIAHNHDLTNNHLHVHRQAVGQANQFNHPQTPQTVQQALDFARMALQLHARLDPVPFAEVGGGGGGTFPARGGAGASLTTDLFVQQQLSIDNWAPGGSNFPGAFNDRGTLVEQGGNLVVTPTSSYQIGNFNLQTASINGQYYYVNDLDAAHGSGVHSPFDITAGASGSADNTTDTSEVRVNLQWVGLYEHPEEAYDPPQGGGYAPPIGALDFFTFDIVGNAAAQYFNPTGLGGSNAQPGLPDLPQLPDLPDFGDDVLPNELTGLNPYGPPVSRSNGPGDYNPYNPTDYTNGYNPYLATSPYNASGGGGNGYNPYLASSPYNASGAPDTSAYLAARGGSAHDADGYSQFDQTWLTAIQQEQGVRDYLDYGSFSSASSAAFRGIHRPLQLTAVNQDELATWIQDNGRMPSTIATEVQVRGDVQGYGGFSNYNEYIANRDDGTVRQVMQNGAPTSRGNAPAGYDSRPGTGDGTPTNDNLLAYNNTNVGNNAPSGYRGSPLFNAGNPAGDRVGSFNTANSYDDNTQGNAHSDRSGFAPLGGDVLSYGGATGYDGYDSSAERERQQAEIDADLERERREIVAIEKREQLQRDLENMESLTRDALELAKRDTSPASPTDERKPTNTNIIEVSPGVYVTVQEDPVVQAGDGAYTDREKYDPAFDVPDDIEEKYRQQQEREKQLSLDEEFERRFGKAENGGYTFDDPYAKDTGPAQLTPLEGTLVAYGKTVQDNGWGDYLDLPKSQYNEIPDHVRENEDFARIMRYKYYLENPDVTEQELSDYDRFLTGRPHDNSGSDTLFLETVQRTATDPRSWEATREGIYDVPREIWSFVSGVGKTLYDGGKDFVEMTPQERGIIYDSLVIAVVHTAVDVVDPTSGDPVDQLFYNAIDFYSSGNAIEQLSDLPPEMQEEFNKLRQDFINNPEKYTREGVTLAVGAALEEGTIGIVTKSTRFLRAVGDTVDDVPTGGLPSPSSLDDIMSGGDKIGAGGFGSVYKLDDSGTVYKVMNADDPVTALANVERQLRGQALLEQADIPHTEIYRLRNFEDEGKIVLDMQDATKYGPNGSYVGKSGGIGGLNDDEYKAFTNLLEDIDNKGLVWGDAKPSNTFFYRENGVLKAGVLDHDLVMPKGEYADLYRKYKDGTLPPGVDTTDFTETSVNGLMNITSGGRFSHSDVIKAQNALNDRGILTPSPTEVLLEAARRQELARAAGGN